MSEQLSGRELDRAIAIALGYTVKKNVDVINTYYTLYSPQGDFITTTLEGTSPAGIDAKDRAWNHVPDYHADANAVIAVCAERGWRLSFGRNARQQPAVTIDWDYGRSVCGGWGATPQEAGARALLSALTAEAGSAT